MKAHSNAFRLWLIWNGNHAVEISNVFLFVLASNVKTGVKVYNPQEYDLKSSKRNSF